MVGQLGRVHNDLQQMCAGLPDEKADRESEIIHTGKRQLFEAMLWLERAGLGDLR